MVTIAGKELLRATISNANFHNKIREESEMWKQWEAEKGLTMMVSDSDILDKKGIARSKQHNCSKHRRRDKIRREREKKFEKATLLPTTSCAVTERWDHSGYKELYPDDEELVNSSSLSSKSEVETVKKEQKKEKRKHNASDDDEIAKEFKQFMRKKKRSKQIIRRRKELEQYERSKTKVMKEKEKKDKELEKLKRHKAKRKELKRLERLEKKLNRNRT